MTKSDYTKYFTPEEQSYLRNHYLDKSVLELIKNYDNILDVGAGAGVFSKKLQDMGKKVTCVDINEKNVEYMKKQGLNAQIGDIRRLPFKDGEFSLVIGMEVIEHLKDPSEGLKELFRVGKNVLFTLPKNHPDEWHFWDIDYIDHAGCISILMKRRKQ